MSRDNTTPAPMHGSDGVVSVRALVVCARALAMHARALVPWSKVWLEYVLHICKSALHPYASTMRCGYCYDCMIYGI